MMKNSLHSKSLSLVAIGNSIPFCNPKTKGINNLKVQLALFLMVMGIGVSWGQGSENFTNIPASNASYSSRSWTGTNSVTWNATLARTDQSLTGKAICTNGSGKVTSPTYSGGMGVLQFNYVRGFTGTAARSIDVYVNGVQQGSTITVSTSSNTVVAYSSTLNISGNVVLELRTAGSQILIDDIQWTSYSAVTPSIAISNGLIAASTPNNGQTNVVLQRYDMAVTSATTSLTGLTTTTAGTYAAADLTNLKCWYQTSSTFNSATATLLSTKSTILGVGSQVFPSFTSQSLASGSTYYIFITADIASGATNGNTINIDSTAFSNITFSSGAKTGTDPVASAGLQTITVAVPDIALSSPTASTANITVGTNNNVIYRFDLAVTTATATLNGITINTATGSNLSGDITNLKCWYQTTSTFDASTATLLSTKTTNLAAGLQVFPTFSSQSLASGSTYYIFITADIPLTATPNNTIIVSAIGTGDLTFNSGNKTGISNDSGIKTIINCTPADVTSAAASSISLSSVLTWINPACYDEILIVAALASNIGTPSGDGSVYTANLVYGSGTAVGNGFVVYKGATSSQTVTGLTNGTQYFYKVFTRRGTTWTSGTEVNATPNIAGYYWNGASTTTNPAAGGTGTWGTANSWRQPSLTGSQATWADNNNAIFAGNAGDVTLDATRIATAFYFNTTGYNLLSTTNYTLTGPINLGNNVGLTFSPNVNIVTPAGGTLSVGNISGTGTANITISSAQSSATNIAQRINIATSNAAISVPINIISAGGSGTGTVAGIVGTAVGTSLSSLASITNNTAIKTVIGATSGNDITANGVISGSADLMFAAGASGGAGIVTLNATNTYTGATIFNCANSGVVKLGVNDALPTSSNVTFGYTSGNGGSLDLSGKNQTLASIINGGFGSNVNKIVNNGATDATLTINGSTSPTAFVFGIQDGTTNKVSLIKSGSGILILDGSTTTGGNSYTGTTTVSGGTLRLNKSGGTTIPAGNSVTVSGGILQISSNQTLASLTVTSGTVLVDSGVTLTIAGNVSIPSGANLILNGVLTSTGSSTLTVASGANVTIGYSSGLATATGTFSGGKTFSSAANYEFNGAATATGIFTTSPTANTVNNLTINRSAGVALSQNLAVDGTLTQTSGKLSIGTNTLTLNGPYVGDATNSLTGSATSNLTTTGTTGTLYFNQTTLGSTNVLKDLTISAGTTTLGNALNSTAGSSSGTVTVGTGATLTTGGNLTLKSDADGTARVGNSAGTISGNVTVERYIPGNRRGWRALTAPVTGNTNTSVFYNWQNNGTPIANTGVEIWSNISTDASVTPAGNASSLLSYTSGTTGSWNPITNTSTTPLFTSSINNAFMVFVTGPYATTSTNIISGAVATTLKATGALITGPKSYATVTNEFAFIGNPYASPLILTTMLASNPTFGGNIWVWDANVTGTYSVGTYNLFDNGTYTNILSNPGISGAQIQSGQAFFVRSTDGASFSIQEGHKGTTFNNAVFRDAAPAELLRVGLYKQINTEWSGRDGAMTVITTDAEANQIGNKMANGTENVAFTKNGLLFASEHHLPLVASDVLNVRVWNTTAGANYKLKINTEQFATTNLDATLEDLFTNSRTPLTLNGTAVEYPFSVTTEAASTGNRFRIVFENSALGINNPKATGIKILPNPITGDAFQVNLGTLSTGAYSYSICNALGQEVEKGSINNVAQNTNYTVKLKNSTAAGMYIMKVTGTDNTVFTAKLIKK